LAAVAILGIVGVLLASVLPSTSFARKRDCVEQSEGTCTKYGPEEDIRYAISPADAQAVEPRLTITGAPTYPSDGQIYFVTVRTPELTVLDWLATRVNPAAYLASYDDLYATQTPEQSVQQGRRAMMTAKQSAEYVALKLAGYDAQLVAGDILVDRIVCLQPNADGTKCETFAPAGQVLTQNDKIIELDGVAVKTVADLAPILARHQPGDSVPMKIERDKQTMSVEVQVTAAPDGSGRTIIGIFTIDTTSVKLPDDISVNINTNLIGGPSAGLAFTLTVLDQLTEGSLMGKQRVAVTGTIDVNGNVGAIGGLPSKASAVEQTGVKYFLVPASQSATEIAEANKAGNGRVEIIPVATISEALAALARLGGDKFTPVRSAG